MRNSVMLAFNSAGLMAALTNALTVYNHGAPVLHWAGWCAAAGLMLSNVLGYLTLGRD